MNAPPPNPVDRPSTRLLVVTWLLDLNTGLAILLFLAGWLRETPLFWRNAGGYPVLVRELVQYGFQPCLGLEFLLLGAAGLALWRSRLAHRRLARFGLLLVTLQTLLLAGVLVMALGDNLDTWSHGRPWHGNAEAGKTGSATEQGGELSRLGLWAGAHGASNRVAVESRPAAPYAPGMSPTELSAALLPLLATPEPPALDASRRAGTWPVAELEARLAAPLQAAALPAARAELIRALILLWHDHLDAAHTLAQGVENSDGSFVHAVMHRREPDAWNSKYWWRRVGVHPAFAELARRATALLGTASQPQLHRTLMPDGRWDPAAFVDACDAALNRPADAPEVRWLRELQRLETEVLLAYLLAAR
jgi:hypothetical protein